MLIDKREREDAEIPSSSMADIAFLLLIFFLLVTTINPDSGIGLVLPPAPLENQDPPPIKDKNLLAILVNAQGSVLIEEKLTPVGQVKAKVKEFINNRGQNPEMSDSPDDAIISIKTSRETPYKVFIDMLDQVIGAYADLRNTAAQAQFGSTYDALEDGSPQKEKIKDMYPKQISIAEPAEG